MVICLCLGNLLGDRLMAGIKSKLLYFLSDFSKIVVILFSKLRDRLMVGPQFLELCI